MRREAVSVPHLPAHRRGPRETEEQRRQEVGQHRQGEGVGLGDGGGLSLVEEGGDSSQYNTVLLIFLRGRDTLPFLMLHL